MASSGSAGSSGQALVPAAQAAGSSALAVRMRPLEEAVQGRSKRQKGKRAELETGNLPSRATVVRLDKQAAKNHDSRGHTASYDTSPGYRLTCENMKPPRPRVAKYRKMFSGMEMVFVTKTNYDYITTESDLGWGSASSCEGRTLMVLRCPRKGARVSNCGQGSIAHLAETAAHLVAIKA